MYPRETQLAQVEAWGAGLRLPLAWPASLKGRGMVTTLTHCSQGQIMRTTREEDLRPLGSLQEGTGFLSPIYTSVNIPCEHVCKDLPGAEHRASLLQGCSAYE